MRLLILLILIIHSSSVFAETVNGGNDNDGSVPAQSTFGAINPELQTKINYIVGRLKERTKYIYLNKCGTRYCTVYLVDISQGSRIVDQFMTLKGPNSTLGCGKGFTEPGLFGVAKDAARPGSSHPGWGEQSYLAMNPMDDATGNRCPHDTDKVIHPRLDLANPRSAPGSTAGCVGMPPAKYTEMKERAKEGAVIYNFQ